MENNNDSFYGSNRRTIDEMRNIKQSLDNGYRFDENRYQWVKYHIMNGYDVQLNMVDRIRLITEIAQERHPIILPEKQGGWDYSTQNSRESYKQELNEYRNLPRYDGGFNNYRDEE